MKETNKIFETKRTKLCLKSVIREQKPVKLLLFLAVLLKGVERLKCFNHKRFGFVSKLMDGQHQTPQ